jgi:RNA polymerase sigma factor (sigma-70 family)
MQESTLTMTLPGLEHDRRLAETIERERTGLWRFIRSRVADRVDAEDVLQDVFSELVGAYRLLTTIDQESAWLFTVARNRITDLFRRRKTVELDAPIVGAEGEEVGTLEDLLPSPDAGPEAEYARAVMLDAVEDALDDLPEEQRSVFVAHEFEGRSFREMSEETGIGVNTLLARKRYAVLRLRKSLQAIYDDYTGAGGGAPKRETKGTRKRS